LVTDKYDYSNLLKEKNYMSNKTPYEIRLDLVREAREILQARAKNPEDMPTTEDVLKEAERLNEFVSKKPNER
jgi:hypothetical protein